MVKAHESWLYPQHSSWQLPDLNCMSKPPEPGQPECLPTTCINPGSCMLPGVAVPGLTKLKTGQTIGADKLLQLFPPRYQPLVPSTLPCLKEKESAFTCGFNGETAPNATFGSLQKGLLVFDQSGNQTRLIYSSVCPCPLTPPAPGRKQVSGYGLLAEQAMKTNQFTPVKPIFHEEYDENHTSGEQSEMHEDTEEINALLYSDEDSECSEDDEVKSTDHSPICFERNSEKLYDIEETSEEVASCDDGPNKRQKLVDGEYKKSSQIDTAHSSKLDGSHEYENDAESSYADEHQTQREQSRKVKIQKTLRMLESIIPGTKGKDPLSVLDEAIDYMQSLKLKAKALGV